MNRFIKKVFWGVEGFHEKSHGLMKIFLDLMDSWSHEFHENIFRSHGLMKIFLDPMTITTPPKKMILSL